MKSWWYKLVGDDERLPWALNTDLPEGADWSDVNFLNQFIDHTNARKAMARACGNLYSASLPNIAVGRDIQSAYYWWELTYNMLGWGYCDCSVLPTGGTPPAIKYARDGFAYGTLLTGGYEIFEKLTLLKNFIADKVVFGPGSSQTPGGTVVSNFWRYWADAWEAYPDGDYLIGGVSDYGSKYSDNFAPYLGEGHRAVTNITNASLTCAAALIPVYANVGLYALAAYSGVSTDMGFTAPPDGELELLQTDSAVNLESGATIVRAGTIGPTGNFRDDYNPRYPDLPFFDTRTDVGEISCQLRCYAELIDTPE